MRYQSLSLCLFLLVSLVSVSSAARANCMEECLGRHDCDEDYDNGRIRDDDDQCHSYLDDCQDQCTNSASSKDIYGALAYDKVSGAVGLAQPSSDTESARASAMSECKGTNAHCEIVGSYSNICVAVAIGENKIVAWAQGNVFDDAQDNARDECIEKGAKSCTIKISHCFY